MAKRFAYLEGQKVRRREAEKIQAEALEPLETVYIRKETLRAVWRRLDKGRSGNLNELMEDLLHRWLSEQEQKATDLSGALTRQENTRKAAAQAQEASEGRAAGRKKAKRGLGRT